MAYVKFFSAMTFTYGPMKVMKSSLKNCLQVTYLNDYNYFQCVPVLLRNTIYTNIGE